MGNGMSNVVLIRLRVLTGLVVLIGGCAAPSAVDNQLAMTSAVAMPIAPAAKTTLAPAAKTTQRDVSDVAHSALVTAPDDVVRQVSNVVKAVAIDPVRIVPTYSLQELEQLAIANNPTLAAASKLTSKSQGLGYQVGLSPNPTIGYFGQQLADQGTDQHGFFVEQEFVRGNKLELNRRVLAHTASAQRWQFQAQTYRVLTDVRIRYFEAVAAQRRFEATQQFLVVAKHGVEIAELRQRAEEGTLVEVLQAQTLASEIELAAQQAEIDFRASWQELAAIAGLPMDYPATLDDNLTSPTESPDWDAMLVEIVAQSPELGIAKALLCEKQAKIRREQAQPIPNITGQLAAGFDNGTDSGMINVQLTAPIPVLNKNQGNISAAYAEYAQAQENIRRIEQSIQARLARVGQDFSSALAAVKQYKENILPQNDEALELSEQAYKAGELDFLQVLVVRRTFFDSTIRYIEAEGRLAQANAKLDGFLMTGGLEAPEDFTEGDGLRDRSFGGQ